MKKKHRDIIVIGIQYGWISNNRNHIKIWKDKKVILEFDIEFHHEAITPSMIAALIKDPVDALMWLNAKPCPYCGSIVKPLADNGGFEKEYFICIHDADCWFTQTLSPNTWILKTDINIWNKRN